MSAGSVAGGDERTPSAPPASLTPDRPAGDEEDGRRAPATAEHRGRASPCSAASDRPRRHRARRWLPPPGGLLPRGPPRTIFQAALDAERREVTDLVLLCDETRAAGRLEGVGAPPYLPHLLDQRRAHRGQRGVLRAHRGALRHPAPPDLRRGGQIAGVAYDHNTTPSWPWTRRSRSSSASPSGTHPGVRAPGAGAGELLRSTRLHPPEQERDLPAFPPGSWNWTN